VFRGPQVAYREAGHGLRGGEHHHARAARHCGRRRLRGQLPGPRRPGTVCGHDSLARAGLASPSAPWPWPCAPTWPPCT
jgi:hypothetical protein